MLKRTDSTSPTNQLATKLYIVHGGGRLLLSGGGVDSINVSLWACFCWCLCFCKKEKRGWSGQCPILSAPVASDSTRHDRTQRTLEPTPPPRTTNLLQNNNTVLCYLLFPTMGSIQSHPDHKEEVISTSNIKNMSVPSFTVTYVSFLLPSIASYYMRYCNIIIFVPPSPSFFSGETSLTISSLLQFLIYTSSIL